MSKKERLKEIINTLRGLFAVNMALIVAVSSGLISRYDKNKIDFFFYSGIFLEFLLMVFAILLIKRIIIRTNELEDL